MTPSTTGSTTRFGIIGTGRITRRLVADMQSTDDVAVTAIASRDAQRSRWYADQYGIQHAVTGYENLLTRDDVDAVYVSLPPSMHAAWSIAAAEHGKHVLCEKPLAVDLPAAQQIDAACRRAGVCWLDATGWLHHRRTDAFAAWLADERFGEIGHLSASVSFYEPFQSGDHRLDRSLGGGCTLDLAWYCGGLMVFAGHGDDASPIQVQATSVFRDRVPIRTTAMVSLGEGISATLSCGYDTATRKWFEIAGSKSSLICDDFTRPWTQRPPRCWIHDSTGQVESHTFDGNQERRMIQRLATVIKASRGIAVDEGDVLGIAADQNQEKPARDLSWYQRQALRTQAVVDAIATSANNDGARVTAVTIK